MDPPPYHEHVFIEASVGSLPNSVAVLGRPERVDHVTDALLNPSRARVVLFGSVRWYGKRGQLLLAPTNANGGGEEAGHLIFYFTADDVNYDVSLHAWASKERIRRGSVYHVVAAGQSGAALPHAIATLKAIVGTALRG